MDVLEQTFARAGFRIFIAGNLEQALASIQQQMPDIVVCDHAIKDVNRESFQQNMPDYLEFEALPFIFLCSSYLSTVWSCSYCITFNKIADLLPGMIRKVDLLARITRRRFLWVLPETDAEDAVTAVQRLMIAFAKIPMLEISASLVMHGGLATAPDAGLSYEELVELAHQVLVQRPVMVEQPKAQELRSH